jgi:ABC-type multidrug transport system fused ATPase/permease subunit
MAETNDQCSSYKTALLIDERQRMLWDDAVQYASALREYRKVVASLLLVLIGIGIFRIELFRSPGEELVIATRPLFWIKVLFTAVIACFTLSAYFMFTERREIRPRLGGLLHIIGTKLRSRTRQYRAARKVVRICFHLRRWLRGNPSEFSGRAISELELSSDEAEIKEHYDADPTETLRDRTDALAWAYDRLVESNTRVRKRLGLSTFLLFLAFVLVFGAFLVYTWSIDTGIPVGANHEQCITCQSKVVGGETREVPSSEAPGGAIEDASATSTTPKSNGKAFAEESD